MDFVFLLIFVFEVIRSVAADDVVFADFEDPNWPRGWTASADFPFPGPVTLEEANEAPPPSGYGGKRFVSTLKGDGAKGTLTSPEFQIQKKYIRVSVAGGNYPDEAYVGLFVNNERVISSTGDNGPTLTPRVWDVQKYVGQVGQIKIVDNTGAGWGFVLCDDIIFSDSSRAPLEGNAELVLQMDYEGSVLLENKNQALPLGRATKVAVFGKAQNNVLKGGGGSGEVYSDYGRNLMYGLRAREFNISKDVADFYTGGGGQTDGQGNEAAVPAGTMTAARAFADVAIVTFSRISGEMYDVYAKKGDYYLSDSEEALLAQIIAQKFTKVVVVLNIGNIMDSSWFKNRNGIDAVLVSWYGGQETGVSMADILLGNAYPSGKLADTMAKKWEDYPSSNNWEDEDFMNYEEDIYVGYRYFETLAPEKVNYEFGFGLAYTEFVMEGTTGRLAGDNITVETTVRNTGKALGKEVVQVYVGAPQGKLGKPAKVLVGFQKTKELAPGESQTVTVSFSLYSFASFDDLGKVADAAYVLEAGDYHIYVGNSVRNVVDIAYKYHLNDLLIVQQLTHNLRPDPTKLTRRLLADGSYENLPRAAAKKTEAEVAPAAAAAAVVEAVAPVTKEGLFVELVNNAVAKRALENRQRGVAPNAIMLQDVAKDRSLMGAFLAQISTADLCLLSGGKEARDTGSIGDMPEFGIPPVETNDGPAGARVSAHETHFPSGTLIACMWNPDYAFAFGAAVADEMIAYRGDNQPPPVKYGTAVWLAPGLNIHRNPLCGRNFEYYSEDPLLAGRSAAGVIRGTQSKKCATTPKHFAGNERERNRGGADSRMSERAAREVFLKNFEIAVREGDPWCMMTSYNVINGQRPTQSVELLTNILRKEWGFSGIVMTDWTACCVLWQEIVAGNNLAMPWGDHNGLDTALADGRLTRARLEESVAEIMNLIMRTHVFEKYKPNGVVALREKKEAEQ